MFKRACKASSVFWFLGCLFGELSYVPMCDAVGRIICIVRWDREGRRFRGGMIRFYFLGGFQDSS